MVQGKVYVGGGQTGLDNDSDCIIMEYDTYSEEWAMLPPYRTCDFAMAVINDQLVLIGGVEEGSVSNILSMWNTDIRKWTHPYPEMSTARYHCSAFAYNEWLVVAGGLADGYGLSSVELLDTYKKEWYSGPNLPVLWVDMKTAVAGDRCYFMGNGWATDDVYSVSIPALIAHSSSNNSDVQIWKQITSLPMDESAPLSINGFLLAVGGRDNDSRAVTDIHLYQPNTGEWVKIGDLPSPRCDCSCTTISNRELFIAGGSDNNNSWQKRIDKATIADL